ncbi:hypothetical protein HNS38_04950 [Lentimicrobium sp. L6]|uniref:hypothetical protein n=1 Tax=Lentimicrobium sp. L6 TaxID=2735916 RepID=UPI001557E262|nr:hypothetical protein [Lentimicrobium sp. L6]NPD84094.1 hypothetical protein [Lentimicrobium sp. L6]
MTKHRLHIASILFWIFLFPIIFQSIHIVWHHDHEHHCEHELAISGKGIHQNHQAFCEKEDSCDICEYQLTINDLPRTSLFPSFIPTISFKTKEIAPKLPLKIRFSNKSPRAPPFQLS